MMAAHTRCVHCPLSMAGFGLSIVGLLVALGSGFVEWIFWLCWSRCPFAVAVDLGRCFWTAAVVSPGQVVK